MEIKKINNWQIETPEGFVNFDGIGKINKLVSILHFDLEDDNFIEVDCSHIFIVDDVEIIASDLIEGDLLETKNGLKEIIRIKLLKKKETVYTPLEVKTKDHSYYANNIRNKNCKFLGSSSTLIDSDNLERINIKQPIMTKWTGLFQIYEEPKEGATYILGIDCAKGTKNDYSVIQILRIFNEKELKQVATYRNNQISPHDFSQVCISVSNYYNNAEMMIENNDIGQSLCDTIWYEYDCDRIINLDPKGLGIRSTRKTKLQANIVLKEYMEREYLEIVDQQTVYELSRYEEITPNVFACGNNENDDTVTALLWALYFIISDFYDGKSGDIKKLDNKFKVDNDNDDGPAYEFV